jgi:TonB family protein
LLIGGAIVATTSAEPREPRRLHSPDGLVYVRPPKSPPRVKVGSARALARGFVCRMSFYPAPSLAFNYYLPDSLAGPAIDQDLLAMIDRDSRSAPCIGPCPRRPDGVAADEGSDRLATIATVDRPAALLSPPSPRYPEQLRAARVTGRVLARFVVDTTGRVEEESIVIRESNHDLFTKAVRAVLSGLRFAPAEVGSRKARMLVDLPFEFRLND